MRMQRRKDERKLREVRVNEEKIHWVKERMRKRIQRKIKHDQKIVAYTALGTSSWLQLNQ